METSIEIRHLSKEYVIASSKGYYQEERLGGASYSSQSFGKLNAYNKY